MLVSRAKARTDHVDSLHMLRSCCVLVHGPYGGRAGEVGLRMLLLNALELA